MADKILGFAVKGVAAGIGLTSESIHHHKAKKREKELAESSANAGESRSSSANLSYIHGQDDEPPRQEGDEEQWDLDEAQDGLIPQASQEKKKPTRDLVLIVQRFVTAYPPPQYGDQVTVPRLLALPVILPQRRPKDRSRGFIRAYAPVLADCGIDQAMFLDFLETFNQATEASPWINAINLAGIAGLFVSPAISLVITVAIQVTMRVAREVDSRRRTNTFLDQINDKFFRPRGVYCLVLTWNPESSATHNTIDLTSTISSSLNPSGAMDKVKHKFQTSSGNTYGDFEFPEAAPLIFPALENLAEQTGEEAVGKRNKMKKAKGFVSDYMDRRARAKYASQNPDSLLAQQAPRDKFTSRYADPNHPANSGSIFSLLTGGYINPPLLGGGSRRSFGRGLGGGFGGRGGGGLGGGFGRGRLGPGGRMGGGGNVGRGQDIQGEGGMGGGGGFGGGFGGKGGVGMRGKLGDSGNMGQGCDMQGGGGMGRGGGLGGLGGGPGIGFGGLNPILGTGVAGIKKILGMNVLYLMIVNMPSDEEMASAMAATQQGEAYHAQMASSGQDKVNGA